MPSPLTLFLSIVLLAASVVGFFLLADNVNVRSELADLTVQLDAERAEPEATTTAPKSCIHAINTARNITGLIREFGTIVQVFPDMVIEAAEAGMTYDAAAMEGISSQMSRMTRDVTEVADQLDIYVEDFNNAADDCENYRP